MDVNGARLSAGARLGRPLRHGAVLPVSHGIASGSRIEPVIRAERFGPPYADIRVSQAAVVDADGSMDIVAIHEERARLRIRLYFGEGGERLRVRS